MSSARIYTDEQIGFVRENIRNMSTRECAKAFTERFHDPIGQTSLRRLMKRNSIKARTEENKCTPVGAERYSDYYKCVMVKVYESRVAGMSKDDPAFASIRNNSWKMKQNLVWEQTTGKKLKRGQVVIFLDGDRMNYEPENLYAVPLEIAGSIRKMQMDSDNPVIYKTALMWGQLYFEMRKQCPDYWKLNLMNKHELELEL